MSLDAILKIGGSLGRGDGLNVLCGVISELGKRRSVLVIPGGGSFADQVREADRRHHLDQTAAHNMALLAMDQYGYLLHHLIKDSCLSPDLGSACNAALSGSVSILLPSAVLMQENPLPHTWQVTSDSIAAWIAVRTGCPRLILLKDVDGLWNADGKIEELTIEQLKAHTGGVDEYLHAVLRGNCVETWIVNGLHPSRLVELLDTGHTLATRIGR